MIDDRDWLIRQIKICAIAERLLGRGLQSDFYAKLVHASEILYPELFRLRTLVFGGNDADYWRTRFEGYSEGIIGTIFDKEKFERNLDGSNVSC